MPSHVVVSIREPGLRGRVAAASRRIGAIVVEVQFGCIPAALDSPPDLLVLEYPAHEVERVLSWVQSWRLAVGHVPIILIAPESHLDGVIQALRIGVSDYLRCPLSGSELDFSIAAQMSSRGMDRESDLVGDCAVVRSMRDQIRRAASSDANVLITGETGSGKEMAAEAIHRGSARANQPFVCVNCAAIPDELLESELFGHEKGAFTNAHVARDGKVKLANGGTLLLDEIGEMSLPAQAKVLRLIDKREVWPIGARRSSHVNSRFIAATNQDLEVLTASKTFRADLFYRLNVIRIRLPPLRERIEDMTMLVDHFIRQLRNKEGETQGFDSQAMDAMMRYDWPGNIRELRNLIESILANEAPKQIGIDALPGHMRVTSPMVGSAEEDHKRLLDALTSTHWNVSEAARKLNWSRMMMYRKMAKYQVTKHQSSLESGARGNSSLPRANKTTG